MNDCWDSNIVVTMPQTQEKSLDCNITNNNDHNYLHKKFKKMASTISVSTCSYTKENDLKYKDLDIVQAATNSSISNGSIAAAHPEIEKIKKLWLENLQLDKDVQTNYSDDYRLSELNSNQSGQTSNSQEFLCKTDNTDNDFVKDVQYAGPGGRYVCSYCKLSCAKPSVLQKHIRAHTNERPYPCVPCGFAFKTKSNLYKHRRSRTHALRLQGTDISTSTHDDDWSADSESDTSLPPTSVPDTESNITRMEMNRPHEFSSPELLNDQRCSPTLTYDANKIKTIYKPKFRAFTLYKDNEDIHKKAFSANADFLNEHISKIISENEAIVDVIETPLQKKYGKIKQIAESKQLNENAENKSEFTPLNLTKNNNESDNVFRKRSHSDSFAQHNQKHPLNPEGSIIKDLLLKTKGTNGVAATPAEIVDALGPLYICPLCQIPYRSADNLEIHRTYYCKGNANTIQNVYAKDVKLMKPENTFMRSNSMTSRLTDNPSLLKMNTSTSSPPLRNNKPDNLIIVKTETNETIAPLPSPGPLLGNTRLVDSRLPSEYSRKTDGLKARSIQSPKRKIDRSDNYSPRIIESASPRSLDMYPQAKIRCFESNSSFRMLDDHSNRHNSQSLQMFGGEVKILDYSGETRTLRIEPSKNELSPIQLNISPSKVIGEMETSSIVVRSGLHSGGTIVHNLPTPKESMSTQQTSRMITVSSSHNPILPNLPEIPHFQFPPLSPITAFNPLTLPSLNSSLLSPNGASTIIHAGKLIPHVPGIPGPNTSALYVGNQKLLKTQSYNAKANNTNIAKEALHLEETILEGIQNRRNLPLKPKHKDLDEYNYNSNIPLIQISNVDGSTLTSANVAKYLHVQSEPIKSLPKTTMLKDIKSYQNKVSKNVDKLSISNIIKNADIKRVDEIRNFNFENLITKAEIFNNQITNPAEDRNNTTMQDTLSITVNNERSEPSYFQKNSNAKSAPEEIKPKFLRPSTLPLKPGTFTPKRHHGITPNANTMPLVSPETPRPAKAYGQLYLNGNAYTYLGLKCSTKVFYCTINRPQPTYVPNQHFLSMYSNWQLLSELTPDPLGLSTTSAMSLYDSRHRPQSTTIAVIRQDLILTHSSQWKKHSRFKQTTLNGLKDDDTKVHTHDSAFAPKKELAGGFESNEEYTYVRGRGRGRYVCSECGIRCKKPSMLKKHIRTHTDVRPYTCTHCAFSFKTKGNLTKHMKSKAHYKKCCELGINPNEGNDGEVNDNTQGSGETDDESDSDGDEGNEGETESSDTESFKSRLPEHEAAHCLLSLGGSIPASSATPGLITSARPSTYPYTPVSIDSTISEHSQTSADKGEQMSNLLSDQAKMEIENEPMDLSKSDIKGASNITEIPTAQESSVLASLASNTAKLPLHQNQWSNGEPMLHAYLTERALLDTKIKQSQLSSNFSKIRKIDVEKEVFQDKSNILQYSQSNPIDVNTSTVTMTTNSIIKSPLKEISKIASPHTKMSISKENTKVVSSNVAIITSSVETEPKLLRASQYESSSSTENAKFVVSEYLKHTNINTSTENQQMNNDFVDSTLKANVEDSGKMDDSDGESIKLSVMDHELVAQKVVIGAGGIAFKVSSKGKEFESTHSYTLGKLMEDGRRVCDFCNKSFTKPSQLRLHLNIHYMERPFRCSACAVSFRTRGHLQKHERSGSHHNKVSMTSTFGAATSLNPRPFRCSDCNIAFRIHGHLAKHLRSKMHVMRLECLFKLPFGTFTEIERAGVSLTDIDTTDCASSLASLQLLARKLHEKDPTKLEYRDLNVAMTGMSGRESSDDEDSVFTLEKTSECEDIEMRTTSNCENERIIYSATDI